MKRIVSLILVALLTLSVFFCFTGCSVNKSEVSILWSGEGEATDPNSLINSMERAMYIKKVEYKHYGAEGDAAKQLEQAKAALENGCQVLVVELVLDVTDILQTRAQEIVKSAKEKDVPVIFFNCAVADAIVESYEKCFYVVSDINTVADVQGKLIADYVKSNFKKLDKNEDGKLSYTFRGTGVVAAAAAKRANELLATKDYLVKNADGKKINTSIELAELELIKSELIITESEEAAYLTLVELQKDDYNTNKLTTHFIPVFTVGSDFSYKDVVLKNKPEDADKVSDYFESKKFLVDLTTVAEEDLDDMIYTTTNVIDAGRLAGTAAADKDSMALAVAGVVRNLCKGNDAFKDIASDAVVVEKSAAKVSYIAYN